MKFSPIDLTNLNLHLPHPLQNLGVLRLLYARIKLLPFRVDVNHRGFEAGMASEFAGKDDIAIVLPCEVGYGVMPEAVRCQPVEKPRRRAIGYAIGFLQFGFLHRFLENVAGMIG